MIKVLKKKMILALSWRDIRSPKRGGAEVQTHGMLMHLNSEKYKIIHISPMFKTAARCEDIDGIEYIRRGNVVSVIFYAFFYYIRNHGKIDYVIDECNTHRFFTPFYVKKSKRIFLIYQLTREIWFINAKFPLNFIGYHMENALLRLYRNTRTITESESTRKDLINVGFAPDNIAVIHIGLNPEIDKTAGLDIKKYRKPVFIYVGRYSAYKGIDICIKAFGIVKKTIPDAKMWIVGKKDEAFFDRELRPICDGARLSISDKEDNDYDITLWGFVSESKKYELMKQAHLLLFPSVREGWGIIVTEAALLGTPSAVSNVPGCCDAVDFGKAGYLCNERTAKEFARKMIESVNDISDYEQISKNAQNFAQGFMWNTISKDVNMYFDSL